MNIQQVKHLVSTVQELSLARDLDSVIHIVNSAARKITGADGATFVLRDNGNCYYVDEDAISPLWKGQRFPLEKCISGWCMLSGKSAVIPDIYLDDRIPIEAYKPTFVKSLLMVPIRHTEPIGAIGNYWASYHQPSIEEIEILQSLANITSVSIENIYAFNELNIQNIRLREIAFLQSHQVRAPIANILGLYDLINFEDITDPLNADLLHKMKSVTDSLDSITKEIVLKTYHIKKGN